MKVFIVDDNRRATPLVSHAVLFDVGETDFLRLQMARIDMGDELNAPMECRTSFEDAFHREYRRSDLAYRPFDLKIQTCITSYQITIREQQEGKRRRSTRQQRKHQCLRSTDGHFELPK